MPELKIQPRVVSRFSRLGPEWFGRASKSSGERTEYKSLAGDSPLGQVRLADRPDSVPAPESVRVAAWNVERCKFADDSAALIASLGADIALLTEMDIGMARSGNIDTIESLGSALSFSHAAAVEFIELGLGDVREEAECAGTPNRSGLHCNAVLSRWRISEAEIIPLDDGGRWFWGMKEKGQRRVGGRHALAVRIAGKIPFWAVAAHFESEGGPDSRRRESERLAAGIASVCGSEPVVLGGDFNFAALPPTHDLRPSWFGNPEVHEPSFAVLADAGFEWRAANTGGATTRNHPWHPPLAGRKIDWLFVRGAAASNPSAAAAVGRDGQNLSDHEPILADVRLLPPAAEFG